MAAYRPIHISYWQDKFILKLTPEQKYFYLYLMTNSKTKQCGIYELPKNVICFETGYNMETINKLLEFFIESKKILYDDETEEIYIKNWIKFNQIDNKNIFICVGKELKEVKNKNFIDEFVKCLKNMNANELYNKEIKGLVRGYIDPTKKETETQSESKEETESKTETKILPLEKTQAGGNEFIENIILLFKNIYKNHKGIEYISIGKNKQSNYQDRNAAGALLKYIKTKYPDETSEMTLKRFESLFNHCFLIKETWLKNNMTLPIINSKLNNIILYGQNGNKEPNTIISKEFDPECNQGIFH